MAQHLPAVLGFLPGISSLKLASYDMNPIVLPLATVSPVSQLARFVVPHLCVANIDPESSLNPTSQKIVAQICTGKSEFMGFPVHVSATIGTDCCQRSMKVFYQPVTHKVTGRVERVSGGILNAECRMPNAECRMANAEWRMANAEWRMPNGECDTS